MGVGMLAHCGVDILYCDGGVFGCRDFVCIGWIRIVTMW